MNIKPNFIGIGAPRTATTWITKCLDEHPEICISKPKETRFLSTKENIKEYSKFFRHCSESSVKGEFDTKYLYNKKALYRIKKHFPHTKLIVCLRNPVERAVSMYYYRKSKGRNVYKTLKEQIEKDSEPYVEYSKYYKYLLPYIQNFPKEHILILIYEDIEKDPEKFIQHIYNFLEVDNTFRSSIIYKKENITAKNKVRLKWFRKLLINIKNLIKKLPAGDIMIKIFKKIGVYSLGKQLIKIGYKRTKRLKPIEKKIDPETEKQLRDYFSKDIENIENIINRKLNIWKN